MPGFNNIPQVYKAGTAPGIQTVQLGGGNSFRNWYTQNKMSNPWLAYSMSDDFFKDKEREFGKEYEAYQLEEKTNKRYDEITNFGSDYYKQFQSYLEKLNPQISANSLLAPLTGSGFNYGTSQKIATERSQQMNTKRTEAISKGVQEFAIGSQGQAGGLLQMLFGNNQFQQELAEKKRQFDESSPTFLDSLLNIGGSLLGQFTGGLLGGGSASSARGSSGLAQPGK